MSIYECKNCKYTTKYDYLYEHHIKSQQHVIIQNKISKNECNTVDEYSDAQTAGEYRRNVGNEVETSIQPKPSKIYICDKCTKTYQSRFGLWKHTLECNHIIKNSAPENDSKAINDYLYNTINKINAILDNLDLNSITNNTIIIDMVKQPPVVPINDVETDVYASLTTSLQSFASIPCVTEENNKFTENSKRSGEFIMNSADDDAKMGGFKKYPKFGRIKKCPSLIEYLLKTDDFKNGDFKNDDEKMDILQFLEKYNDLIFNANVYTRLLNEANSRVL